MTEAFSTQYVSQKHLAEQKELMKISINSQDLFLQHAILLYIVIHNTVQYNLRSDWIIRIMVRICCHGDKVYITSLKHNLFPCASFPPTLGRLCFARGKARHEDAKAS